MTFNVTHSTEQQMSSPKFIAIVTPSAPFSRADVGHYGPFQSEVNAAVWVQNNFSSKYSWRVVALTTEVR